MASGFEIRMLLTVFKDIKNSLNGRNTNTIEALGAMRKAFNYTYNYLINNHGNYIPNMELADLWNEASTKVMKVNSSLGSMLGTKSRFWAHPEIYFELNRNVDILTLKQITDEMERLQMDIR